MLLLCMVSLAFAFASAQPYTRSFLRGLKTHEDDMKRLEYINGAVSYIEKVVLHAAREGKTYYTEPFYGCHMYGDPFLTKHCDSITQEVRQRVEELFPECDLAYDPKNGRYILSWM